MGSQGSVTVIAGGAGSGKTTLARAVCAATGARLLDLDAVTADMVAEALAQRPEASEGEVLAVLRDARYDLLVATARDARQAADLVVAAPFTREIADPGAWSDLVQRLGGPPVRLVWISVTAEERARRLRLRGASRDAALLEADRAPEVPPPADQVPHLALAAELPTGVKVMLVGAQGDRG